jgi:soluble lytic murein transglycosylase
LLRLCLTLILLAATGAGRAAESLETLARAHRNKPTAANRAALLRFAAAHPKDSAGALARLVAGVVRMEKNDPAQAVKGFAGLERRLPTLADHLALPLATALLDTGQWEAARRALDPIWKADPVSPLRGRAALLAARIDLKRDTPQQAVLVLEREEETVPQPAATLLLARALEAKGDAAAAAAAYQRIYFEYPKAADADEAESALTRLRATLGAAYPRETPELHFTRIRKLRDARDYTRARRETAALAARLDGASGDRARLWLGLIDYERRETAAAYRYLRSLEISDAQAGAERLYYLVACARRLENEQAIAEHQAELARRFPASPWRLQALVAEANYHLLENRPESFLPLYRACAESFPNDPQAPYCHWKLVWSEYLRRGGAAVKLLREHLSRFPASEKAGAALYFLGRLAETAGDRGAARAWYAEAADRFPNSYYGIAARDKAAAPALARVPAAPEVKEFLGRVAFPPRQTRPDFTPTPAMRLRLARARLLASAALDDWAVTELRFAGRGGVQPHVAALELARICSRRGEHPQAIRHIKSLANGYLFMPLEAAPIEFWKLAFPIPFRAGIEKHCRRHGVDPYLFAALIRQESEFDPRAVSRSRALGLSQIMPSTGRQLARKLGYRRFSASMLFRPEVNLNLGAYEFNRLTARFGGKLEPTLAAYNAGPSRADRWLSWGEFREPAEFIETIPITETRNYIQIVLRNAELYRRLYGAAPAGR